jgi:hypothetical protein
MCEPPDPILIATAICPRFPAGMGKNGLCLEDKSAQRFVHESQYEIPLDSAECRHRAHYSDVSWTGGGQVDLELKRKRPCFHRSRQNDFFERRGEDCLEPLLAADFAIS